MLEALLSNAPVGIGFVDRDFRIVRLNERLAALHGSAAEAQLGRTVAEVVPDIWPQLEPLYRQALESGEAVVDHEVSGLTAADPLLAHHWMTTYYPVSIDDEIIGVGVIVVDVTERKQAQRALRLQSDLLSASGQAIIATDATLRRLETSLHQLSEAQRVARFGSVEANLVTGEIHRSDEYDRILGLDPGDQQSSDQIIAMIHPDDRPAAALAWAGAVERGVPFDIACRLVRPDSEQRWIRFRVVPERDDDGTVVKVIGTLLDETERIEADRVRHSARGALRDRLPAGRDRCAHR